MHKTNWKIFSEAGTTYRIRAEYGLDKIGDQEPYVAVGAEVERKGRNGRFYKDSGGTQHELVAKHFPELTPLIKWHLSGINSGPMHYVANALYWFEMAAGRSQWRPTAGVDSVDVFKRHVVLGAVADDVMPALTATNDEVTGWLLVRLPALLAAMRKDLEAAGIDVKKEG